MTTAGPEHTKVRLPLIEDLVKLGWQREQLQFSPEWHVPKTPSEASKREAGASYKGFPVDIAIFDEPENLGHWEHIVAIFETKSPGKKEGISQLETYLSLEPRVKVGYWTNGTDIASLFRLPDGSFKKELNASLPKSIDDLVAPTEKPVTWDDLQPSKAKKLRATFERLLNSVVANDSKSTRRDDQLNQLSNLLLVKLESDRKAKISPTDPVIFQVWSSEAETEKKIQAFYKNLKLTHSDLFSSLVDQEINLDASSIQLACFELSNVKLIDTTVDVLSTAFQVFRTASLKSEEGQYFTPLPVIQSAVTLMDITYDDIILDPACGTGGFLLECFKQIKEKYPNLDDASAKAWAQKHLYGVDKDQIGVKLTKAMMMILGDGSAHTFVGDSIKSHLWNRKYPFLVPVLRDEAFTCIITNPPFGQNLKISAVDARHADLSICQKPIKKSPSEYEFNPTKYQEREIGLAFFERCYRLLVEGGRLGIVLPETYFFSSSYAWLNSWIEDKFILRGMANVPMEAFQGFCRAKTNFYVFERI